MLFNKKKLFKKIFNLFKLRTSTLQSPIETICHNTDNIEDIKRLLTIDWRQYLEDTKGLSRTEFEARLDVFINDLIFIHNLRNRKRYRR